MINSQRVIVVMPAYNAENTLRKTYEEIPFEIVDDVVIVDDDSNDQTLLEAEKLGIKHIIRHNKNKGYGGNQKTCYDYAMKLSPQIIVMLHPDYQYTPKLIPSMTYLIANGLYDVVLGSRILGRGALKGGMPKYKYLFNRLLTLFQNVIIQEKLSEYHTGYRAFSVDVLNTINYHANSDGFVFDNQMLAQISYAGFKIGEISCPTQYFAEASSISLKDSIRYGIGVIATSLKYFFQKTGLGNYQIFNTKEEKSRER